LVALLFVTHICHLLSLAQLENLESMEQTKQLDWHVRGWERASRNDIAAL